MNAKRLIRELQSAIDDNDGDDVLVGLDSMEDDGKYGYAELVCVASDRDVYDGRPAVVLIYN